MTRLITPRRIGMLLILAALFLILEIFTPAFMGDGGTFALTAPVQDKYETVDRLNGIETAIYSVYILGVVLMGLHMLRGFDASRSHALFKAGVLLMLTACLLAIYRMYCIYGKLLEFGLRISTPLYINAALFFLLAVDMFTGHRLYPANTYALIALAVISLLATPIIVLSNVFTFHVTQERIHQALVDVMEWAPLYIHDALLCIGLYGYNWLIKKSGKVKPT